MIEDDYHSKGGLARAEALTPERRAEIAKQGALSRWGYKATHKGNFKEEFGIDMECQVLNDDQKTAVITQTGMGEALGLGKSGSRLPRWINSEKISPLVGPELKFKLENPIIFQGLKTGQTYGFDIKILIDLCDLVIEGYSGHDLTDAETRTLHQAHILRKASAYAGIQNVAWRLAGFDPTREEVINAFKDYVLSEAARYKSEFPHKLFEGWCRLYPQLRQTKIRNNFSYFEPKHLFRKLVLGQIYFPIDDSNGAVLDLIKRSKAENPGGKRLFHYLTEIVGLSALRRQIGKIEGIQKLSDSKGEYEKNFVKVCGKIPTELTI